MEPYDAIVIGAGEAGALVASRAVADGHRVAMLYREPYGSTCVNVGCVPSKFLLHRARVAHVVRTASRFHITGHEPQVDLAAMVADKDELVEGHRTEGLTNARAAERLTLIAGEARFVAPTQVMVDDRLLVADQIFIATGMRPDIPTIDGLDAIPYLTNETVMDLTAVPEHLIVLGGGYIGCELAQAYARFGARVTIIHGPQLLCPDEEPDISTLLSRALRAEGIELHTGRRAVRVATSGLGVTVTTRDDDGLEATVEGSHLLVATGRRPNSDMLDLDAAGIRARDDGSIAVDGRMASNVAGIWAIGDVNGQQPFTRVCQEEAKIAYANAFEGADVSIDRRSLGHAVFTDPEVASVGLTEAAARAAGHEVAVGLVTFDQIEKAELIGETTGLIKYVVERDTRHLLGAHVIGPDAGNLLYAATVVLRRHGTLDELATAVGIFPTLAEGMEGTARGLLRRMAPEVVGGPLVAVRGDGHDAQPVSQPDRSGQQDSASFACPACAGEFEALPSLQTATTHDEERPR